MSEVNHVLVGDRVLYRYSPAGIPVYGSVMYVKRGEAHVRTNIKLDGTYGLILVRKLESWQVLSDNSPLHKHFGLEHSGGAMPVIRSVILSKFQRSVPPVILDKLRRT